MPKVIFTDQISSGSGLNGDFASSQEVLAAAAEDKVVSPASLIPAIADRRWLQTEQNFEIGDIVNIDTNNMAYILPKANTNQMFGFGSNVTSQEAMNKTYDLKDGRFVSLVMTNTRATTTTSTYADKLQVNVFSIDKKTGKPTILSTKTLPGKSENVRTTSSFALLYDNKTFVWCFPYNNNSFYLKIFTVEEDNTILDKTIVRSSVTSNIFYPYVASYATNKFVVFLRDGSDSADPSWLRYVTYKYENEEITELINFTNNGIGHYPYIYFAGSIQQLDNSSIVYVVFRNMQQDRLYISLYRAQENSFSFQNLFTKIVASNYRINNNINNFFVSQTKDFMYIHDQTLDDLFFFTTNGDYSTLGTVQTQHFTTGIAVTETFNYNTNEILLLTYSGENSVKYNLTSKTSITLSNFNAKLSNQTLRYPKIIVDKDLILYTGSPYNSSYTMAITLMRIKNTTIGAVNSNSSNTGIVLNKRDNQAEIIFSGVAECLNIPKGKIISSDGVYAVAPLDNVIQVYSKNRPKQQTYITGQYTGNGSTSANAVVINFTKQPYAIAIWQMTTVGTNKSVKYALWTYGMTAGNDTATSASTSSPVIQTWTPTSLSFYCNDASQGFNYSKATYKYMLFY